VGITAGSREVPGRKACDKRHPYRITTTTIITIVIKFFKDAVKLIKF